MNQGYLYTTLDVTGCKIISFEDYPSNQGSWRVCFLKSGLNCEVISNRFDGFLTMESRSDIEGCTKSIINSTKVLNDESELAYVKAWLLSLSGESQTQKIVGEIIEKELQL